MPLDSTQVTLDPAQQAELFGKKTGMTKALEELTAEWSVATNNRSPMMFDVARGGLCGEAGAYPTTPMRIEVDDKGFTRKVSGAANANVCLRSMTGQFFDLFMSRTY